MQSTYIAVQSPVVVLKLADKNVHRTFSLKSFQKYVGLFLLVNTYKKVRATTRSDVGTSKRVAAQAVGRLIWHTVQRS